MHRQLHNNYKPAFAAVALACAVSGPLAVGGAAEAAEPTSNGQMRNEVRPSGSTSGFQLPPVAPSGDARSSTHRVNGVRFRGNRVLSTAVLSAVGQPYAGRDLDEAEIEQLRIALTRLYTDQGYINSGVILDPEDPYGGDLLHFQVIEGRLTEVRVHGLRRLRKAYVISRLRGAPDETFNINRLRERFQLLLDDPLFAHLNSRVLPGASPGEAVLDVQVDRARPFSLTVAVNNYRPPSIDEKAYLVGGTVRDLTGLGDVFDAVVSGPFNGAGGVNSSVGWRIPINSSNTQLGIRAVYGSTVISEEPLSELDIRSYTGHYELNALQPLIHSVTSQLSLGAAIAREYNDTELGGTPFSLLPGSVAGNTRDISFRLGTDYGWQSERQYLGVRLAVVHVHLLNKLSGAPPEVALDRNYFVETLQARHLITFPTLRLELESRGVLQRTSSHISDLHALPVGGVDSVRGFRENTLLESNVTQFNIDLRWQALRAPTPTGPALSVGPFFDWATARDLDSPFITLSSAGGTLRFTWAHCRFDLAVGARIRSTSLARGQHGSWQDHGIHAQLATDL
jgi:hemolysin activation/secretion protein